MKTSGLNTSLGLGPVWSDTVQLVPLSTTPVVSDWPANARDVLIVPGASGAYFNGYSTGAASAGSTVASTSPTGRTEYLAANFPVWRMITADSTGFSVLGTTAAGGQLSMAFYSR